MPAIRTPHHNSRSFLTTIGLILALILTYWILADWQYLARLISLAVTSL
jgi:hypothetical protein